MRRVIFNQKGGVGKSSITVNLAAISAARGLKTLIVDLDPQCNASQYLLGEAAEFRRDKPEIKPNIGQFFAEVLNASFMKKEKPLSEYVHKTPFENLYIVPSNPELREIEYHLQSKHKIYKLSSALKEITKHFDAIYIDTPPAFNFYTLSALIAADRCLIPFDCDAFSRHALYTVMDNLMETKGDHNDDLQLEGIVVNQFQPRASLPAKLVEELRAEGLPIVNSHLSSSVIMKESHLKSMPLIHLAPKHKLTEEYVALFDELQNARVAEPA